MSEGVELDEGSRGRVDRSPARHVPRVALDWIVDEPDRLWRLVEGTMVFADISGFTALSERLATKGRIGAEELVETLSRVFGAMLDTAAGRGGQLLKFGGDALLFLFDGDDHARQAASTAVEMRAALRRASDLVTSVGRLSLSISIGVHTGQFHLFLVGSSHRELVVLGPGTSAVVAAENAASAGEIVLSPGAAAALEPSAVRRRDDGALLLRWRKAPVDPGGGHEPRPTDRDASMRLLPAILVHSLEHVVDPAHRVATISFMKFSGTDAILDREGPDVLAERLHETISIAQAAFVDEDVALLCVDCDADGGKLFASAGVPLTSEDDEGRMLRAAETILAAAPPLPLQIGVNRGHVFAAEIGTVRRAAYSAMGDTTNTAARICGKAEAGCIYVHPDVLEHARALYESEPVGPFDFKGKALPQVLYRLGEEAGARAEDQADALPLVGRDDELALISGLLAGLGDGVGASVVVAGPVGIGKSRLVRDAIAVSDPPTVLSTHAEPYGAANAFRIFRDPLRSALGVERGPQHEMAAALEQAVRRHVPQHQAMLALIADVVQVEVDPSNEVLAIAPEFRPDRTADVIIDLLDSLHPDGLVLVVEDAHWADDSSAHLVGRIARQTAIGPWAVVVTRRDDPGGVEVPAPTARLELGPLHADAVRAITIAAAEAAPLRHHVTDQIVDRAAGNPLFAEELVRAVQEWGSVEAVPSSLQGAMAAQVDALDPLSKRVLSYASVLGRSFRRAVLREVLRQEEIVVDDATIERLGRFLEAEGPTRYRFRNGLLRDVVYDGLGFHLRSRLHLEAGRAVERVSSARSADADTLALHFSAGGDHERAYRYGRLAAERAERSYANATAAARLEQVLDAARRSGSVGDDEVRELWIRLGNVRELAGLYEDAIEAFRHADRSSDDLLERCELRLRIAAVRASVGKFSVALGDATRIANLLADADAPGAARLRARVAAFSAYVRRRQERPSQALALAEEAAAAAGESGERAALARAYAIVSWGHLRMGTGDAVEFTRRALDLFVEVGDLVGEAQMATNLGVLAYYAGDWVETIEWYRRSERAFERIGNLTGAAVARCNIGEVMVNQGRLDEAEPLLLDATRILRVSGHMFGDTLGRMTLGRLEFARGRFDEAEAQLRRSVEANRAIGNEAGTYETSIYLARCLTAAGRAEDALSLIERALDETSEDMSLFVAARAIAVSEALIELGRPVEARDVVLEGIELARARDLTYDLARLLMIADRLSLPVPAAAEPWSAEAGRLLERLGVVERPVLAGSPAP